VSRWEGELDTAALARELGPPPAPVDDGGDAVSASARARR
jgi:hypothetical protein